MKKKFDCVEMQHQAALEIYEKLKGKTVEEQIEFWRQKNREKHVNEKTIHEVNGFNKKRYYG